LLTAHQHILGYSVPENGVKNVTKERKYNQGCLATIIYEKKRNLLRKQLVA